MENEQRPSEPDDSNVIERLHAFGNAPLAEETANRAFRRLRTRETRAPGGHAKWVVAAAVAGFMAGSVGLAAADVLPAPVQDVAHHALDAVGVHVPPGHQRFNDPATCPGGPYANHGAYVRAHHDDPNAGESPCGKPLNAVTPGHESDGGNEAGGHGQGKGKGPHNEHLGNNGQQGKGNGHGNGHGNAGGTHGKPDQSGTKGDDQPEVGDTPTSVPAPTTTSTTPTTDAPTTTTTTTLPGTPTT